MKWEMEGEEIEAVLEKIWDLHDKLSDAIHSISRAHFLNSIKSQNRKSLSQSQSDDDIFIPKKRASSATNGGNNNGTGFVYVKDYSVGLDADVTAALQEAKSLNVIRTALENLEDQLEFFHTVQTQQRSERDAAIARLEQSRIVLALRLAEHRGKKYKVIEEARALVGDVHKASHFVSPEKLCCTPPSASPVAGDKNFPSQKEVIPNAFLNMFASSFKFVRDSLKVNHMGGILGNAALFTISMFALMHLHRVSIKDKYILELPSSSRQEDVLYNRRMTKVSRLEGSSSSSGGRSPQLDVLLARG